MRVCMKLRSGDLHKRVGTTGLELQEQVAEQLAAESSPKKGLDAIITPCGGGGLTSGVALSVCLTSYTPYNFLPTNSSLVRRNRHIHLRCRTSAPRRR